MRNSNANHNPVVNPSCNAVFCSKFKCFTCFESQPETIHFFLGSRSTFMGPYFTPHQCAPPWYWCEKEGYKFYVHMWSGAQGSMAPMFIVSAHRAPISPPPIFPGFPQFFLSSFHQCSPPCAALLLTLFFDLFSPQIPHFSIEHPTFPPLSPISVIFPKISHFKDSCKVMLRKRVFLGPGLGHRVGVRVRVK